MPDDLHRLVEEDFPRLRAILEDLVRIPSVSAPGHDPENVRRSADHVAGLLRAEGLSDVQLLEL
ncbi:MAG TPA: dipeptidase, partial [Acidimicrobiia bacterium]|nr:dipeptidase [Acidimicrobiia bacterium]